MRGHIRLVAARLRAEQSGFTLMELMMSVALLAVVLGAVLSLSDAGGRIAKRDLIRADAIEQVQVGLARMDRELRTATQVITPTSTDPTDAVEFIARVRPSGGGPRALRRVRYQCDALSPTVGTLRACYRYEGSPTASPGGAGQLVIDHLVAGPPVFKADASPPTYFSIHIRRAAGSGSPDGYDYAITHDHGVYLRAVDGSL